MTLINNGKHHVQQNVSLTQSSCRDSDRIETILDQVYIVSVYLEVPSQALNK